MIACENVSKWYGAHQVLESVNLVVEKGQVVVICGPSGSGKSTLLRCINRLEPIQQGRIIVDGTIVTDSRTNLNRLRTEIGIVFQSFNLYPHMTALRNITIAPTLVRKIPRSEADEMARALLSK